MSPDPASPALKPRSFSDVDASGQADEHAAYLQRVAARVADRRQHWLELLQLAPGMVVLDAGSGMGEVTRMLAERVGDRGRGIGVDTSTELVERAGAAAVENANVEYRVADVTSLPFDTGTFDAAYSERASSTSPTRPLRWASSIACCGQVVGWSSSIPTTRERPPMPMTWSWPTC